MHIIADLGGRLISLAGSVFISILPDFAKFDADMAEHLKPAVKAVDIKVDEQGLKSATGAFSGFGAAVDGAMLKARTSAAKIGDSWIATGTSMQSAGKKMSSVGSSLIDRKSTRLNSSHLGI